MEQFFIKQNEKWSLLSKWTRIDRQIKLQDDGAVVRISVTTHSKKVVGWIPGLSVTTVHALPVSVLSVYSTFFPQGKNIQVSWVGDSKVKPLLSSFVFLCGPAINWWLIQGATPPSPDDSLANPATLSAGGSGLRRRATQMKSLKETEQTPGLSLSQKCFAASNIRRRSGHAKGFTFFSGSTRWMELELECRDRFLDIIYDRFYVIRAKHQELEVCAHNIQHWSG